MSRAWWKHREREAAAIIGGRRHAANQGGDVDGESDSYCAQVKERQALSLTELEILAIEIDRVASQKPTPKLGLVMVKRRPRREDAMADGDDRERLSRDERPVADRFRRFPTLGCAWMMSDELGEAIPPAKAREKRRA